MQDAAEGPRPEGEPGAFSRLLGVFFSPASTFESIARKPTIAVPIVLMAVWALAGGLFVAQRLDVDAMVQKQIAAAEKQGQTVSEDQIKPRMEFFIKKVSPFFGPVYWIVVVFLVPGIYHGLSALLGKSGKYMAVVSAYAYVQMVQLLKSLLTVVIALPRSAIDPEDMTRLLRSNVGAFVDPETTPAALRAVLGSLDVFDFWCLALGILALTRVTRLRAGAAAGVVLGVWVVYVLGAAGLAALGSAFGA